jgi:serine/threonine protein kinase
LQIPAETENVSTGSGGAVEGRLTVEEGDVPGAVFLIQPGETRVLGSAAPAHWILPDPELGARHAVVLFSPPRVFQVIDLGVSVGTRVNDRPLKPRKATEIRPKDLLRLGRHTLRVDVLGGALEAPSAPQVGGTMRYVLQVAGGDYVLGKELGSGALGRVFAATRKSDGRAVAIKALHRAVPDDSVDQARFLREGRLAMRVESPYVIEVLDVGVEREKAYLVLEQIEGPSLLELLKQGELERAETLRYGLHVARALLAASAAGVVHRDVKPANIVVADGTARLGDFGAARAVDSTTLLTAPGQALGSMAYMAPEQLESASEVCPRADLYSLGATLYHLLAKVPPFRFTSLEDLERVFHEVPPPLSELCPGLPAPVGELVDSLLAKEPQERPSSEELVQRLEAIVDPTP